MNKKGIIGIISIFVLLLAVLINRFDDKVLGAKRSFSDSDQEVGTFYYVNRTGKSSRYITYKECEEVGEGTIIFDESVDALVVRNDPDEVSIYLNVIPDYYPYLNENEDIKWMTIYRSRGVYRVIGEVVEAAASDAGDEEFLVFDDGEPEDMEERTIPEEAAEEEIPPEPEEEIIEEVIEEEPVIPSEYDTISDLINSGVTLDMTVSTRGYYSQDDGGAGEYVISDIKGTVYEKLGSGLYANLQYSDSINIRQLGAKGNAEDDDSSYLIKALSLRNIKKVIIPEGDYNLAGAAITIPRGVSIEGVDRDNCKLIKLNFTAPNGINMSNVTCEGAAERKVLTPAERLTNDIMIDASPKGAQSIIYTNCVFKNADIASFAFARTEGRLAKDIVTDCIFEKMGRVAVYHSTNADNTKYTGNTFSELGDTGIKYGPVSAIWIGDVTNNSYTKSKNIEIKDNKFYNLYTADDVGSVHSINANFICIRGDKAVVSGNQIENLYGFGGDRESVYTKVGNLTVDDNTIINGGCGEGYICNKGVEGELYAVVTNNRLIGEYGCGIRQYGPATINNNTVDIRYCPSAITITSRGDQVSEAKVEICENTITSGIDGAYYHNGKEITSYSASNLIKVISPLGPANISGNKIYPGTAYSAFIAVGNAKANVNVDNNTIDSQGYKGIGISLYNNAKGTVNAKQEITFNSNVMTLVTGQKGIAVNLSSQSTVRTFFMEDNTFTFSNATAWNYPMSMTIGKPNKDTLKVSGNHTNSTKKRTNINYSAEKLENNDPDFATFTKK